MNDFCPRCGAEASWKVGGLGRLVGAGLPQVFVFFCIEGHLWGAGYWWGTHDPDFDDGEELGEFLALGSLLGG